MKQAFIYINYNNIVVLKTYLDVFKAALEHNGYVSEYCTSLDGINKDSLIVVPMGIDAFKFYLKGYRQIILWQQGATSEESYLRNHSKLRMNILNFIDCFVMKKAKFILFVSENLRRYYEEKAGRSFKQKSYLMPCFNESFDPHVFNGKDYTKKTFAYVGSLDLWQCFKETVDLFHAIETAEPGATLKVLTFTPEDAISILKERGVKNYEVKSVPKDMVRAELADVSYGFIYTQ